VTSKLLLLITDLQIGGTPAVVRELAVRLRQTGADVQVACLSEWGPVADQLKSSAIPVTALDATSFRDLQVLPRLIRLIRQGRFTTVFSFLMHANAMAAAASLFVPDVRWIQSIQTTQPLPRWHWMVQKIAQHAAEKVVVPSASVARIAQEWARVPHDKIVVIPNAIDPGDWSAHQSKVPAENPRPYPVIFLGRLDPIKDVPTLVSAVARLSPLVHLHIYGEGSDRARIENRIRETRAPVTLHGSINSPQAALEKAGLLVLPSLAEGFGLVLIEAMAAGVPVVATDVPGIRDVVRDGATGLLVNPGDVSELAAAIKRLIEDAELHRQLVINATADVQARFSWSSVLTQYRQLLGD
jgi:glycosyltransferase involved in cell wall biosynthesis